MPGSIVIEHLGIDAPSVVSDPQLKSPVVILDFHFDPFRPCVFECITKSLARDPVDFVSQYWMEAPRGSFHVYMKLGSIRVRLTSREFLSQGIYRERNIVRH